jgi:hypothetical protein
VQYLKGMDINKKTQHSFTDQKIKTNSIKTICKPTTSMGSQNWKLGTREDRDDEPQEAVLSFQGIIANQDLPPIEKPFEV